MDNVEANSVAIKMHRSARSRPRTVRFPLANSSSSGPEEAWLSDRTQNQSHGIGSAGLEELGNRIGKLQAKVQRVLKQKKGSVSSLEQSRSYARFLATPARSPSIERSRSTAMLQSKKRIEAGTLAYTVDSSQSGKLPRMGGPRSINPLPYTLQVPEIELQDRQFMDERLQKFASDYEKEVKSFASVALHAEMKLNQLELLGSLPNKLALAVSLDVLRRLGEVGGRYQDLIARVHDSIFQHCYLNVDHNARIGKHVSNISNMGEDTEQQAFARPSKLSDYLCQKAVFEYVEGTTKENEKLTKEIDLVKSDRLHSIRLLADKQRSQLVWDAIHCQDVFHEAHLKEAVSRNPRAALISVWKQILAEDDPETVANHVRTLLATALQNRQNGSGKTLEHDFNDKVMMHLWKANVKNTNAAEDVSDKVLDNYDKPSSKPTKKLDPEGEQKSEKSNPHDSTTDTLNRDIFRWLLDKRYTRQCTELVEFLKGNIDKDQIVVAEVAVDGRGGNNLTSRRAALEKFLLGASHEDIDLLRSMILTWDFQNGIEWKMITEADRQENKRRLEEDELERQRKAAQDAARKAELAHKAIFSLKSNVAGKVAMRLQKKKRLAAMMAKFRNVALTTVRMGGVLEGIREDRIVLGPKDKNFQANADEIKKEVDRHLRELLHRAGKDAERPWVQLLDYEISTSAAYNDSSKRKGKKRLFSKDCLPHAFSSQLTSLRMAYKDIKRIRTKSLAALLRLSSDIFLQHALISQISNIQKNSFGNESAQTEMELRGMHPDLTFAKSVYAYFLKKYGLPEIADANMVGLASALVKQRHKHPRLDAFARMCFDEVNEHVALGYCIGICRLAEASAAEGTLPTDKSASGSRRSSGSQTSPKATKGRQRRRGFVGKVNLSLSTDLSRDSIMNYKKSGKKHKKTDLVEIPVSEDWCCSVSAVKASMSVTMRTVHDDVWEAFLSDIEATAANYEKNDTKGSQRGPTALLNPPVSPNSKAAQTSSSPTSPSMKGIKKTSSGLGGKRKLISQFAKGQFKAKFGQKLDSKPYSIKQADHTNTLTADSVLEIFLKHWSNDLGKKEDHLAKLFLSSDVDGDGELTASEFTALVHSIDPDVPVTRSVEMYRSALRHSNSESINPEVFVKVCYETGLVHQAWKKHNSLLDVANGKEALISSWKAVEPFVLGTLRALERDLPSNHSLRVLDEAGDGSLPDLRMQLDNLKRFAADSDMTQLGWHTFWILLKNTGDAASEGPGVQTLYGNDLPGTRRAETDACPLEPRNTKNTPPGQRRRRNGLPFIMIPDAARVSASVSSWGPSGGQRKEDYLFPARFKIDTDDEY